MHVTGQQELAANILVVGTASLITKYNISGSIYFLFAYCYSHGESGVVKLISHVTFCNKEALEPSQEAAVLRCFFQCILPSTHIRVDIHTNMYSTY